MFLWLPAVLSALPNIVHVVVDDLGWAELGIHRSGAALNDTSTPFLDKSLATESLLLERMYTHKICSPTRCALQSGRAPIHVNVQNVLPEVHNPKDPIGGYQGIPLGMTGMASRLRPTHSTHMVGKWDAGMATPEHSPSARGYESWLGYWHHANDYWSLEQESCNGHPVRDLWRSNATFGGPAKDLQNPPECSQSNQSAGCVYEEILLTLEVTRVIKERETGPTARPFFLFWAMHLVHMPLEVPFGYLQKFNFIDDTYRRSMHAMVNYVDNQLDTIVTLLKSEGVWNSTLMVVHSDNGGEIMVAGVCGGNNYPLRGGKFSNWEGGIRVMGWVTGGWLPPARRGQRESGLVTAWDFYATYIAGVAGGDPTDKSAATAGLPSIDSVNQLDLILGRNSTPPRTSFLVGDTSAETANGDGKTLVGGMILDLQAGGLWKLLLGAPDKFYRISQDVTTGPSWPNSSSHLIPTAHSRTCGRDPERGCLFELNSDPIETTSLAVVNKTLFKAILQTIDQAQASVFSPVRGPKDAAACRAAEARGGWWGPWLNTSI